MKLALALLLALGCGAPPAPQVPENRTGAPPEPAASARCHTFASVIGSLGGPDAGGGPAARERVLLRLCADGKLNEEAIACGIDELNDRLMCVCTRVVPPYKANWDAVMKAWYLEGF